MALDIGGTSLRGLSVDRGGATLVEHAQPTRQGSADELLDQLVALTEALVPTGATPAGIGVSVAAAPDPGSGRLHSIANIHGLEDVPLAAELRTRLGARGWAAPVVVANDAELAAVAEGRLGAAVGLRDFVSITIGTGIGMGVALDGATRGGWRGMAGELAFLPVRDATDPLDDEAGAYEALVAGRTLAVRCAAEIERSEVAGEQTRLRQLSTIAVALALAEAGDPAASRLIDLECVHLALGIAAVCAILDPQLIVLSGGIGSQPALAAPVRRAVAKLLPDPPPIETSALGERAPLLGALERARDAANDQGPMSTVEAAGPLVL